MFYMRNLCRYSKVPICIITTPLSFQVCQCVMMWGIVIGGIIFGSWADKYGRRKPLITAIFIEGVTSIVASVIPWYWVFLVNWFILALASGGVGIISFVICMEVNLTQDKSQFRKAQSIDYLILNINTLFLILGGKWQVAYYNSCDLSTTFWPR